MDTRRKILQSYPVVLSMLQCRGYDTSMYAPLTSEMVQEYENAKMVEPIVVRRRYIYGSDTSGYDGEERPPLVTADEGRFRADGALYPFCGSDAAWEGALQGTAPDDPTIVSRELRVIADWTSHGVDKVRGAQKFRTMYPELATLLDAYRTAAAAVGGDGDDAETRARVLQELLTTVVLLYRRSAIPIAEVHYSCFAVNKLSVRREVESKRLDAMQSTLETDVLAQHVDTFRRCEEELGAQRTRELENEATRVYQSARVVIIVANTPKKVVADSDKVRVQIFDIKNLLFDIRKHMYVPDHEIVDVWQQDQLVQQIKNQYHIGRLSTSLPIIYTTDPVAKFIGLSKNNLCKITRTNDSSGTYTVYRYCL